MYINVIFTMATTADGTQDEYFKALQAKCFNLSVTLGPFPLNVRGVHLEVLHSLEVAESRPCHNNSTKQVILTTSIKGISSNCRLRDILTLLYEGTAALSRQRDPDKIETDISLQRVLTGAIIPAQADSHDRLQSAKCILVWMGNTRHLDILHLPYLNPLRALGSIGDKWELIPDNLPGLVSVYRAAAVAGPANTFIRDKHENVYPELNGRDEASFQPSLHPALPTPVQLPTANPNPQTTHRTTYTTANLRLQSAHNTIIMPSASTTPLITPFTQQTLLLPVTTMVRGSRGPTTHPTSSRSDREISVTQRERNVLPQPNTYIDQVAAQPRATEQTLVLLMQQLMTSDAARARTAMIDRHQAKVDRHDALMATLAARDWTLLDTEFNIDQMDTLLQTELESHQAGCTEFHMYASRKAAIDQQRSRLRTNRVAYAEDIARANRLRPPDLEDPESVGAGTDVG
jgi:hypothetical protein